jgi:hypothetical protein
VRAAADWRPQLETAPRLALAGGPGPHSSSGRQPEGPGGLGWLVGGLQNKFGVGAASGEHQQSGKYLGLLRLLRKISIT